MKVVTMTVPGRFPTVVVDPGNWWSAVAVNRTHTLSRFSANAAWWRLVCDPDVGGLLCKGLNWKQRFRRRLEWTAAGINLSESGRRAAESLEALCQCDAYTDADSYISAVNPLAEHLDALNRAQDELEFGFEFGVRVRGLNYADSAALVGYSKTETLLSALVTAALAECPDAIQFLVLSVTSPEDLLCASIVVGALRQAEPAMHACLADHGYENFSLQAHIPELHKSGQLTTVFDTLIVSKDDRDSLVPQLIEEVDVGKDPHGFVTAGTRTLLPTAVPPSPVAPPPEPTFTPEPVFWTRVSKRRCYWSRCAFCVQNTKYESPESPSLAELPATLDRLEALATAGYRNFIFSDEALSPTLLERLSRSIVQRGLTLRWACRSKLELAHTRCRFDLMKQAGCYEVLFGLESISPRIQKRMDKYTEELDKERIQQILWDLNASGIGVHVNLIANFPGETLSETTESVEFVVETLRHMDNATYLLNRFALFPGTPILKTPAKFGVIAELPEGDMPSRYGYTLVPEYQATAETIDVHLPGLHHRLSEGLGWNRLAQDHGAGAAALELYFGTGLGSVLKSCRNNPFANPIFGPGNSEYAALGGAA